MESVKPGRLPRNSAGAMPMTVSCCRFNRTVVPMTPRIAMEAALPEAIADDGHRAGVRFIAALLLR